MNKVLHCALLINLCGSTVCLGSSPKALMSLEETAPQKRGLKRKVPEPNSVMGTKDDSQDIVYNEGHMITFANILQDLRINLAQSVKADPLPQKSSEIILDEFRQHFSNEDLGESKLRLDFKKGGAIQKELEELLERTVRPHITELQDECDLIDQVLSENDDEQIILQLLQYTSDIPENPEDAYTELDNKYNEYDQMLKNTKVRASLLQGALTAVQSRYNFINQKVEKHFTKGYILTNLKNYHDKDFNTATPLGKLRVSQLLNALGV